MRIALLAACFAMAMAMEIATAADPEEPVDSRQNELKVAAVPETLRSSLRLDPFYKKYVSARGLPVLSSEKASDYALLEAAYLIDRMLLDRPDVRDALVERKVRFVVMASTEMTTDVPEHGDLRPAKFWNRRAPGAGVHARRPAVSCGEENLLRFPGDPYATESILVHEFAHAIHGMGLNSIDEGFQGRLEATYRNAMQKGLWKDKYAATNVSEYWAEGRAIVVRHESRERPRSQPCEHPRGTVRLRSRPGRPDCPRVSQLDLALRAARGSQATRDISRATTRGARRSSPGRRAQRR